MRLNSGERTLLASVLMSAPGPIVVGIGLLVGHSSTQLADFIRRTAELAAIIVSWFVYRTIHQNVEMKIKRREKLETNTNFCFGAAMCVSGMAMLLFSLFTQNIQKGNVIPGLIIAVLGVIANSIFWLRYSRHNREMPDAILATQGRLYRAKTFVDVSVTIALVFVATASGTITARYVDLGGSIIVSTYLIVNGIISIRTKQKVISP